MRISDTDRLETDYPERNKCEINNKECEFSPVSYICHECGTMLCSECAVGVIHQPQLVEYEQNDEKKQAHCPDCASKHSLRLPVIGGGAAAVLVGLLLAVLLEPVSILIGLVIIGAGAYILRREFTLKKDRAMMEN